MLFRSRYTFIFFFCLPSYRPNISIVLFSFMYRLIPSVLFIRTWVENLIACLSIANFNVAERGFLQAQAKISDVTRKRKHFLCSFPSVTMEGYSIVHRSDIARVVKKIDKVNRWSYYHVSHQGSEPLNIQISLQRLLPKSVRANGTLASKLNPKSLMCLRICGQTH